jgi:hypothetical protein
MKKIATILFVSAGLLLFTAAHSTAQIYVRTIPPHKNVVKPVQPSHQHVWKSDEWVVYKKKYVFVPGQWAVPPQQGLKWVPGKWERGAKGQMWKHGRWAY